MFLAQRLMRHIREVVFGLEDSFVSTLGTVSGVAVGSGETRLVLLTGAVLVVVEAISMAAGSYLSSQAANELYEEHVERQASRVLHERFTDAESLQTFFTRKGLAKKEVALVLRAFLRERTLWLRELQRCEYRFSPAVDGQPLGAAFVMGICYILGGVFVLLPYFFLPLALALPAAILCTVVALFFLGVWKASLVGVSRVHSGVEMVVVSLGAAFLGMCIGRVFLFFAS